MTFGLKRTQETLKYKCDETYGPSGGWGIHVPLSVTLLLNVIFALSEGIPEFDGPVTGSRDNLSVVSAEADRKHVGGVADKATGGQAGVEIPQTEGVIPRRRKGELTIGRDDDVRDEVVVTVENALRVSVGVLVAGQLPNDDSLVWVFGGMRKREKSRKMQNVPREAVKIISGFSEEVAMAVTHPLWPSKEPRKRSDSVILCCQSFATATNLV